MKQVVQDFKSFTKMNENHFVENTHQTFSEFDKLKVGDKIYYIEEKESRITDGPDSGIYEVTFNIDFAEIEEINRTKNIVYTSKGEYEFNKKLRVDPKFNTHKYEWVTTKSELISIMENLEKKHHIWLYCFDETGTLTTSGERGWVII